jgi:hypothetical protein
MSTRQPRQPPGHDIGLARQSVCKDIIKHLNTFSGQVTVFLSDVFCPQHGKGLTKQPLPGRGTKPGPMWEAAMKLAYQSMLMLSQDTDCSIFGCCTKAEVVPH